MLLFRFKVNRLTVSVCSTEPTGVKRKSKQFPVLDLRKATQGKYERNDKVKAKLVVTKSQKHVDNQRSNSWA